MTHGARTMMPTHRFDGPIAFEEIAHGIPCQLVRPDRRKRLTTTTFDEHGGRSIVREEARQ